MTIDALIILAGALVVLLPQLGFPNSWDRVIFFILGMFVIALGIVVRRMRAQKRPPRVRRGAYMQSEPVAPAAPVVDTSVHEEVAGE